MNQQFELFEIANPCIGVCTSNKKGYCFGCLRSRVERQLWHDMTTEQRREVLRLVSGRKLRIEQMRQRKGEQLRFDFEEDVEMGELF
ncbi:putative oxidoreductase [Psychrobacter sp. JCM 18903]|uniref:DUF1289 domain-containing protein n=1 Tax=Psychrobacter sp. JCM 18903 TaxID=1298610 RepID=UPI000431AAA9|nr:DUF1289 domain-containing protein [Psychrobacter sp. JCM 18903]GAF60849.1 putative oxidoreductase [Psychrobacter sp. JCM 18903]